MVAILSIEKAADQLSDQLAESVIEQSLNTWVKASWKEFIQAADNPKYQKHKFYYFIAVNTIAAKK